MNNCSSPYQGLSGRWLLPCVTSSETEAQLPFRQIVLMFIASRQKKEGNKTKKIQAPEKAEKPGLIPLLTYIMLCMHDHQAAASALMVWCDGMLRGHAVMISYALMRCKAWPSSPTCHACQPISLPLLPPLQKWCHSQMQGAILRCDTTWCHAIRRRDGLSLCFC